VSTSTSPTQPRHKANKSSHVKSNELVRADRQAKAPSPNKSKSEPRYLQVARELTAAISGGKYQVGDQLPTEVELCKHFQISRFTAREAIRRLSSAGLISRRQRIGTVVIATPGDARYTQSTASIGDLIEYANDTELKIMFIGKVPLSKSMAVKFGAEFGDEWTYAVGLRHESILSSPQGQTPAGRPFCITRIYLNPALKGIDAHLRDRKTAIYAIIEREYGIMIRRVEQSLQSVALDADDAANLGAVAGSPALLIERRYLDADGRLVEIAENIYPGERIIYRMQMDK
jgi:GntR family transcriptional regulator